jgi:hypothetical protein
MVDLAGTKLNLPDTMVDLPNIMVDLPNTMVDLPNTMIDLPNTVGFFSFPFSCFSPGFSPCFFQIYPVFPVYSILFFKFYPSSLALIALALFKSLMTFFKEVA